MESVEIAAGEVQKEAIDLSKIDALYVRINTIPLDYVGLVNLAEGDVASEEGMASEKSEFSFGEDHTTLGSFGQITVFTCDVRMDICDLSAV